MNLLRLNYGTTDPLSVFLKSYLDAADSLFEFDAIVADPVDLDVLFQETKNPEDRKRILEERKKEFLTFLQQGGLCVLILRPVQSFTWKSTLFDHGNTITNYDWLDLPVWRNDISPGSGFKLKIVDPNSAFVPYLKQPGVRWSAYIEKVDARRADITKLAEIGGRYFGAAEFRFYSGGRIVVLPECVEEGADDVLLASIERALAEESSTPPPGWLGRYELPGEEEKNRQIGAVIEEISVLESRKQQIEEDKQDIVKYKKLLYESGRYQLEPVVRDALGLLGFTVHGHYVPEPRSNIEIDAMIECESGKAIVEIKGSTKAITLDDFSQLTNKRTDDFKITNDYKQALLIGNGFRLRPPKERPSEVVFDANHVIPSAVRQDVSLLNTIDLYQMISRILSGDSFDLKAIRETILSSKGVCKFD